jgi:hypothetical protein
MGQLIHHTLYLVIRGGEKVHHEAGVVLGRRLRQTQNVFDFDCQLYAVLL